MTHPCLPLLTFLVALALCWPQLKPLPGAAIAESPRPAAPAPANMRPVAGLLPRAGDAAHAVTLAQLGDGRIMAAWFSGSREGARDVAIYASLYDKGAWSPPRIIIDRERVAQDTRRSIRKLGNPVLWRDAGNVLHLWFVSVSYGGWAGSSINYMRSNDGGDHWSAATRIVASPFWNISTLVRNPPIAMADGGMGLPVYHEFLVKRSEWLRFDRRGILIDKARIPDGVRTLQPAAVALDRQRVVAVTRDSSSSRRIHIARSENAGRHWQPARFTDLANPDSAIALLRLADGGLLLACNPLDANRNRLALLRSIDDGRHWSAPYIVEQGAPDDEFSYPALLQDDAGIVHLAYTWKRQAIKHIAVSSAVIGGLR